mmetsp:Transcript_56752/g.184659  ORF Transcript_56752/g.184659 Transcript_56752/m.184659 type:complete len:298 (-) Transcript_56752:190-1083(-)
MVKAATAFCPPLWQAMASRSSCPESASASPTGSKQSWLPLITFLFSGHLRIGGSDKVPPRRRERPLSLAAVAADGRPELLSPSRALNQRSAADSEADTSTNSCEPAVVSSTAGAPATSTGSQAAATRRTVTRRPPASRSCHTTDRSSNHPSRSTMHPSASTTPTGSKPCRWPVPPMTLVRLTAGKKNSSSKPGARWPADRILDATRRVHSRSSKVWPRSKAARSSGQSCAQSSRSLAWGRQQRRPWWTTHHQREPPTLRKYHGTAMATVGPTEKLDSPLAEDSLSGCPSRFASNSIR